MQITLSMSVDVNGPCPSLSLQDDSEQSPFVSRVINRLANYAGGVMPNVEQEDLDEEPDMNGGRCSKKRRNTKGTKKVDSAF